ncbi:hypothetical protein FRB94_009807 [Tulasnella sp. JGI-2019a]|nr:hypothetical protein FRB94_009807 [Tulasnella sp. JGI-2019a]
MLAVTRANQCLLPDEVLVQIFRQSSQATLASAAVVCRAWNEPALQILWEEGVNFEIFLKLLGGVFWMNGSVHFDNECTDKHLDRLLLYGAWIKSGYITHWLHNTVVDELRTTIAQLSRPLLPLMYQLNITLHGPVPKGSDASHALVFTSPILRKLWFTPYSTMVTMAFCMQLPILSPILEDIVLYLDTSTKSPALVVAEMLAHLPALRHAVIEASPSYSNVDAILSVLGGHKNLEGFRIQDMDIVSSHSALKQCKGSLSLRWIISIGCSGIELFIKSLSPVSELTQIEVTEAGMSSRAVAEFFQALGTFKRLETLILEVSIDNREVPSVDVLGPLRFCSMLETLSIALAPRIPMHDNDLEALLSHLPHLINFRIEDVRWKVSSARSNLTLRALAIIATLCPMIQSISIKLDASKNTSHAMEYHPTLLDRIDVQGSHIEDAEAVAQFFLRLPASRALKLHIYGMEDDRTQWKEVGVRLAFLQDARGRGGLLTQVPVV